MNNVDILIQTTQACTVHFYNSYLAVAWVKVLIGNLKPSDYLDIFKALYPMNPDALTNAQHWVEVCFGAIS
jgi:hypothetical protein